jgi:2-dehydropantoate 2-reductase
MGLNCTWQTNVEALLWRKAAINSCINPLTALLNCRNGELLVNPIAQQWLPQLIDEIAAISSHSAWLLKINELTALVSDTCQITAANYSSMQQDFHNGRKTEIDAIVRPFIELGEQNGQNCPALRRLYDAITHQENWQQSAPL